jgi:hypothetical protein
VGPTAVALTLSAVEAIGSGNSRTAGEPIDAADRV